MPPERPSGGERRARVRPDVALHPPPRPGTAAAPRPGETHPKRPFPHSKVAPAVLGLSLLLAAAVGVFVLLPRWVANRQRPAVVEAPAPGPSPAAAAVVAPPEPVPAETAASQPEAPPEPEPALAPEPAAEPEPEPEPETAAEAAGPAAVAERATGGPGAEEWTRAMSEALAALDGGRFAEARAALTRAEAARPGTTSTADALRRAEEGLKGEALAAHRERGASAEAREDWKAALGEYEAALKVEPQVAFALEGRSRSLPRAQMDERLAGYVQQPQRLGTESVAREAEAALATARRLEPAGPRLRQQTAALERLLQEARTTVEVRLVSDGHTDVVVLRVATLGAFRERTLALRPGSYVVVGRRQGYRDTRKTFVVSPGRAPAPLDVRCVEAL